jgi:hypothetical protein
LVHKLVSVSERKHADKNNDAAQANDGLALREMLSAGELNKIVTISGEEGLTAVRIHQKGPIAYIETTTAEVILDEDENRLLQLSTDESHTQTKRIVARVVAEAAGKLGDETKRERIRLRHQTAQRLLKPYKVLIPFAEKLSIPTRKVTARRAIGQLLGCIQAVALLRQYRKTPTDGAIRATAKDYEVAYRIMLPVLKRAFAPVNERALELYDKIVKKVSSTERDGIYSPEKEFTVADCEKWSVLSRTAVRNRLVVLVEAGLIIPSDQYGQGNRRKNTYRLNNLETRPPAKLDGMVSPDELRELLARDKAQQDETVDMSVD